MFERSAGVLLPIASLPGPYGCGVLGEEAVAFARRMRDAGLHCWQILPTVQPDAGNSPYTSVSAFAGNLWYIDPRLLAEDGLLTEEEAQQARYPGEPYSVDYEWLENTRPVWLRKAYSRADEEWLHKAEAFAKAQPWVEDYACFMTLRTRFAGKSFRDWPDAALARHDEAALAVFRRENGREIGFWVFAQYLFYRQWMRLKTLLDDMGMALIGDMPIYVSLESADTWAHRELFLLNAAGKPSFVAGTPPDYFSEEGQLWGNPLYDWQAMEREEFSWWLARLRWQLELCHGVRIDHFRAFESFWAIPADSGTAKNGEWRKGPGMALFDRVYRDMGRVPVIAEDLGVIDDKVRAFLAKTGLPGMRVLQFAFDPEDDSLHLPHHHVRNCVAYTGTHDNNTALGFLWEASPQERDFALAYCGAEDAQWQAGGADAPGVRALLRTLWQSPACLAIAPIQDFCGYGSDTRVNIPGKPEGNWRYRLTDAALASIDVAWIRRLCFLYRRDHPFAMCEE